MSASVSSSRSDVGSRLHLLLGRRTGYWQGEGPMAERSSDLRADVAVLRRRWRIIAAAVVLGVGLGVLYAHVVPPQLTSRSLVLLSNGGSSDGGSGDPGADTQVQIVLSTPVLAKAGRAVHPALSATEVLEPSTSIRPRRSCSKSTRRRPRRRTRRPCPRRWPRPTSSEPPTTSAASRARSSRTCGPDGTHWTIRSRRCRHRSTPRRSGCPGRTASPRWASGTLSCWPSCRPSRRTSRSSWTASRVSWPPAAPSAPPPPWPRSSSRPLRPRALTRCSDW